MNAGIVIKDLRTKKGLTQQQLATMSGVTQGTLSQIESGTYTPRPMAPTKISKALATPMPVILISALERKAFGNITDEQYAELYPKVLELISHMG